MGGKLHVAEIPWVAILRTKITDTPIRGIYILYIYFRHICKRYI